MSRCRTAAVMLLGAASAVAADGIPTRVENRGGRLVVSSQTAVELTHISAGRWTGTRARLVHEGKEVWSSPVMQANFNLSGISAEEDPKFVRLDVDGNGRPDFLYFAFARKFGGYGRNSDRARSWSKEESERELGKPWYELLCGALSGLIILDDEKTIYAFNYGPAPDPFRHVNPYVQGEVHYKAVARGVIRNDQLEVTSPIPATVWGSIKKVIEERSCNTPGFQDKLLPLDQRIKWDAKPKPFGIDWRPYFAEGLAMYGRAQKLYGQRIGEMPAEERGTKRALGVFDLEPFFETFPFDEVDPDNKSPEYTAMLNDYAFYQMAPEDATEAVGFENKRKAVGPGVVAMLAHVIRRDPKRTPAYLNLADALWRNSDDAQAARYYKQYAAMTRQTSTKVRLPSRVLKRAGSL